MIDLGFQMGVATKNEHTSLIQRVVNMEERDELEAKNGKKEMHGRK